MSFYGYSQSGCTASFTYDASYCPNIHFYDNSVADSAIVCWMYDYNGEGSVDWCASADNKFSQNGTYVVCLGIMTIDGCTDSYCDTITIDCICERPESDFDIVQDSTLMSCQFVNLSSSGYSDVNWLWDFGDGTTDTVQNPSHTYSVPGTYPVCLSVEDSCDIITSCKNVETGGIITTAGQMQRSKSKLNVYPNPGFGNQVKVVVPELEPGTIEFINLPGEIVLSITNYYSNQLIDIDGLARGAYIIQYNGLNGSRTARFIRN